MHKYRPSTRYMLPYSADCTHTGGMQVPVVRLLSVTTCTVPPQPCKPSGQWAPSGPRGSAPSDPRESAPEAGFHADATHHRHPAMGLVRGHGLGPLLPYPCLLTKLLRWLLGCLWLQALLLAMGPLL
jgi:hypothetical protein